MNFMLSINYFIRCAILGCSFEVNVGIVRHFIIIIAAYNILNLYLHRKRRYYLGQISLLFKSNNYISYVSVLVLVIKPSLIFYFKILKYLKIQPVLNFGLMVP